MDRDLIQFHNPFYNASNIVGVLKVSTEISCLSIWTQCYYRFLPTLEIANGGKPLVSVILTTCYYYYFYNNIVILGRFCSQNIDECE